MLEQSQILWQKSREQTRWAVSIPCLAGLGKSTSPSSNQYMAYVWCWEAGTAASKEVRCSLTERTGTVGPKSHARRQWEVAESLLLGKLYLSS